MKTYLELMDNVLKHGTKIDRTGVGTLSIFWSSNEI